MKISVQTRVKKTALFDLHVTVVSPEELKRLPKSRGVKAALFSARGLEEGDVPLAVLERWLGSSLLETLALRGFKGKTDESCLLNVAGGTKINALLFVGRGEKEDNKFEEVNFYRRLGSSIFDAAKRVKASKASLSSYNLSLAVPENHAALVEGLGLGSYVYDRYKSKKEDTYSGIRELVVFSARPLSLPRLKQAQVLAEATNLARDLINMPGSDCNPVFFVRKSREIARRSGLQIQVFDQARLRRLGCNSLLAVNRGSSKPAYLIKLVYKPRRNAKQRLGLLGKGITFDSGGLCLKPGKSMEDMKGDMSGAAAVLAAMQAVAALKPQLEVRGYIPLTENMIAAASTKPGDVVKALSGKTIEILNTDAEGRLILADALTMAQRDKCDCLIDLATLTGSCMVALGTDYAGLFASDDKLAEALVSAGVVEGERLWRMPLAKEYKEQLKSTIADIKNIGGNYGGAITAALFLQEFVEKVPWAHLDIAGPAFSDSDKGFIKKGGVGFGVRTVVRYVLNLAGGNETR